MLRFGLLVHEWDVTSLAKQCLWMVYWFHSLVVIYVASSLTGNDQIIIVDETKQSLIPT